MEQESLLLHLNAPEGPDENSRRLVLDTNACLDWLVFRDSGAQAVGQALAEGRVRLLSCAAMRDELSHMLRHASLARWLVDADAALAIYDHHCRLLPNPQPGAGQRLACSDPDDQVFIDLAVTQRAYCLLTHDRALLKLARRARSLGVRVVRPKDWLAPGFSPGQTTETPSHHPPQAPQPPTPTPTPPSGRSAERPRR